jgi:archaellum component FlaC
MLPSAFVNEVQKLGTPDEKLERTVVFMQEVLEGGGVHQFREFWEARRLCLELFQTPIHPTVRVRLWTRYSELCREARRLKELFEEQSSYVTEQIEKAIDAIEEDFAGLSTKLTSMPEIQALRACRTIQAHLDQYQALQHELSYLNAFASRITSLRKEVLKTEIRHKQKARLLDRLRALGDGIYPRRKQAIQDVSVLFIADVDAFIQATFVGELKTHELFDGREEIKTLQGIGKLLTLSTEAFTKTRLQLSECWDSIKTVLREKKKAQTEQRQAFRHHRDEIMAELDTVKAGIEGKTLIAEDARKQLRQIDTRMHTLSLGNQDIRLIREIVRTLEALVEPKSEGSEKKACFQEKGGHRKRAADFFARAAEIIGFSSPLHEVEEAYRDFVQTTCEEALSKADRLELDRLISKIRKKIEGLRYERMPSLSLEVDVVEQLSALEHMRADMKHQLDVWRKASGGFGCDFSEGLRYSELAEEEKARLGRIDAMIQELQERLSSPEESFEETEPRL